MHANITSDQCHDSSTKNLLRVVGLHSLSGNLDASEDLEAQTVLNPRLGIRLRHIMRVFSSYLS